MSSPSPARRFLRYSWLLVFIIGVSLTLMQFVYLQNMSRQMINNEISQHSQMKLNAIRMILQQHLDAAQSYLSFVRGDFQTHGFIEENEVKAFTRGIMNIHPGELQAMTLLPPQGMGSAIMINQDGSISNILPASIGLSVTDLNNGLHMSLLDKQVLRIMVAGIVGSSTAGNLTAYVAFDWNLKTTDSPCH